MYKKVSTDLNFVDREKATERFWKENQIFEKSMTPEALPYHAADNIPPGWKWNLAETACFGNYMYHTAGAELAFTLETPYFRATGKAFGRGEAVETGRCFARALRIYHGL